MEFVTFVTLKILHKPCFSSKVNNPVMIWCVIFAYCRAIDVFAGKKFQIPVWRANCSSHSLFGGELFSKYQIAANQKRQTVTTGVVVDLWVRVVILDQYINSLSAKYKAANKRRKQKIYFNKFHGYRPASVSGSHFQNKQSCNSWY